MEGEIKEDRHPGGRMRWTAIACPFWNKLVAGLHSNSEVDWDQKASATFFFFFLPKGEVYIQIRPGI
jgi:hypothetical protein